MIASQAKRNLRELASMNGSVFVDFTNAIHPALVEKDVLADHTDYHPNLNCTKVMSEHLYPVILKTLQSEIF